MTDLDLLASRLRAIQSVAEFLAEHGADLPEQPTITSYAHVARVDVAWYIDGGSGQKSTAAQLIRKVGGKWDKFDGETMLYLRQERDGLRFTIGLDREAVCERVVKGTRKVTIPAVAARPARVETVEDVEWVCGSLLAEAVSA